jgi:Leucine-rich repeat (LRR) protein
MNEQQLQQLYAQVVELAQNILTAQAVEKISTLADLEHLNLTECGLDAGSLEPLKKLENLQTLLVEGNSGIDAQTMQEIVGVSGDL